MQQSNTVGISPKAVLAFAFPFIATVIGVALDWVMSGHFDVTAIRIAVAGFGSSALAFVGAWLGVPGNVPVTPPAGPASDDLLSSEAHAKLGKIPPE
jgi:hypothetical protein